MTNLVPEKRLDKNGRLVTKHVRSVETAAGPVSLPRVPVAKPQKAKVDKALEKRIRRLNDRIFFNFNADKFEPPTSEVLKPIIYDAYHPGCTHNEFYDMLERLPLSETIVLLNYSLRAKHLDDFAKKNKFESYLVDNSELVGKLRERGITAPVYFQLVTSRDGTSASIDDLVDAAECRELYPNGRYDGMFEPSQLYPQYLLAGQIRLSDLKDLGVERCKDTENYRTVLLRLAKGESQCTAKEIATILNKTAAKDRENSSTGVSRVNSGARAYLAMNLGIEMAESTRNPKAVEAAFDVAAQRELSLDDSISFCRFANEFFEEGDNSSDVFMLPEYVLYDLWQAGVPVDLSKDSLDKDLTTGQIIAIHTEGIESSVSSGWL